MNEANFEAACNKIIGIQRERSQIGTLGEKTVHAVLKSYLEPDEKYHEIKIKGYYADIANAKRITEIQTRSFNAMRDKLKAFLPEYEVTIVHPIPYHKWICWIDEETGEVTKRRKSPKVGTAHMIFPELYRIKEYLTHPNLRIRIIMLDMEEYRLLNGWSHDRKKGSSRYDRIPLRIEKEIYIDSRQGYDLLLPDALGESFTTRDYKDVSHISLSNAQKGLHLMNYVQVIEKIGKKGRLQLYQRCC